MLVHPSRGFGKLAGPPLDEPEADQGRGEAVGRLENVGPPLLANREPPDCANHAIVRPPLPMPAQAPLNWPSIGCRPSPTLSGVPLARRREADPREVLLHAVQ